MIVGISGRKRSGKDTVFDFASKRLLAKTPNLIIKHYAYAAAVKDMAVRYFGVDPSPENKENVRFVYQGIGQMIRDEVDKNFWINRVQQEYQNDISSLGNDEILVGFITDIRYPNETVWLENMKAPMVWVEREAVDSDSHPSETSLSAADFTHIINNTGSEQELQRKVIEWVDTILIPKVT